MQNKIMVTEIINQSIVFAIIIFMIAFMIFAM